jgi:hypothetical protein
MIFLSTTTSTLAVITSLANTVAVSASWAVFINQVERVSPQSQNYAIAAAGSTTIVPPPTSASVQNEIEFVSICNTDVVTNTITVNIFDGLTTVPVVPPLALQPGYTLYYENGVGWYVTDTLGNSQGIQGIPGTPGTNGTNGTNAGNTGNAIVNFGAFPGSNTASVVVTGQSTILATSNVQAFFMADTTSDHNAQDHQFADLVVELTVGTIVPGVGFTINATCADLVIGTFETRFTWT